MRVTLGLLLVNLLLVLQMPCWAQRVAIGLFDNQELQSVVVQVVQGDYSLCGDSRPRVTAQRGHPIYIHRQGDSLSVTMGTQPLGLFRHVVLLSTAPLPQLQVSSLTGDEQPNVYPGNLSLTVDFQRIMCINLVEINDYLAAVALAELGPRAELEAYKAQVILARTYLFAHLDRHLEEGFNLCDNTHCQAYRGGAMAIGRIAQAAQETEGLVLVDAEGALISAVFHANCGGQTATASQFWLSDRSYLQSVEDPDCWKNPRSRWTQSIPLDQWRLFLRSKLIPVEHLQCADLTYSSRQRRTLYALPGGYSLPFRDLREYFHLKSAWFNVSVRGDKVILEGRGYGHGVGLCQQGAMAKAKQGWDAEKILSYYFANTHLIDIRQQAKDGQTSPKGV